MTKTPEPPSDLTKTVHAALIEMLQAPASPEQLNNVLRHLAKWRAKLIHNTIVQKSGHIIKNGPFAGMNYGVPSTEGGSVPRLLGGYEASLTPIIDQIVDSAPDLIIDVGCAEGYYAVGLARRLPNATIWARDANLKAIANCTKLAEMNGVADRVETGGIMVHRDFDICLRHRTVVICDIEGGEIDLLQPNRAKGLFAADILVECHPSADPKIVDIIRERFTKTHNVQEIGRELDSETLPNWMETSSDLDRLLALWEWRTTPTPWLWMTAKPANQ